VLLKLFSVAVVLSGEDGKMMTMPDMKMSTGMMRLCKPLAGFPGTPWSKNMAK